MNGPYIGHREWRVASTPENVHPRAKQGTFRVQALPLQRSKQMSNNETHVQTTLETGTLNICPTQWLHRERRIHYNAVYFNTARKCYSHNRPLKQASASLAQWHQREPRKQCYTSRNATLTTGHTRPRPKASLRVLKQSYIGTLANNT
jgi:hypothetical protein